MNLRTRLATAFQRRCRAQYFDAQWYLDTYPDVAAARMDPATHYARFGQAEGRLPAFMFSVGRERDLLWGLEPDARVAFADLAAGKIPDQSAADRVWATLALARAHARAGDWPQTAQLLGTLDPQTDLVDGFCLADPSLLAIEAWVRGGQTARAQAQLQMAQKQFGALPDLALAQANVVGAGSVGPQWAHSLSRFYRRHRLAGVDLMPATADLPAFDRLCARATAAQTAGPLVSVVMPVRDGAATIPTALRSLGAQSWGVLEIIVVDNGSRDATAATVQRIMQRDPRIRLLDGSGEAGAYGARNLGMAAARGEFVTVMDADDWCHPDRILQQVTALRRAPARVVGVMASWVRVTPDLMFTRWWKDDGLIHPDISSLMLRAGAQARLGAWDLVRGGADTEYVARAQALFGTGAIRDVLPAVPLAFGRVHATSLTQASETQIGSYFLGARRDYENAARRWHASAGFTAALPLPAAPAVRPFTAPDALIPTGLPTQAPTAHADPAAFDDRWYLHSYSDLRAQGIDPLQHFQDAGEAQGRSPCASFSPSAYRMAYGPFDGSAWAHYRGAGQALGYAALPDFAGHCPPPDPQAPHIVMFGHQAGAEVFGGERSLLDTLDAARQAGVTVSVVLPHILNAAYLAALQKSCARVYVRPYGWRFGHVAPPEATVSDLADLITQSGATQVHVNTCVLDAPLHAARLAGVPCTVHVHELPASDPRLCMGLGLSAHELRLQLLREVDRFIVNTPAVARWLDAPPARVRQLPNQIDDALFALPDGRFAARAGAELRVGLIGTLVAKKGLGDMIAVARAAQARGLPLRFVLVGPMTPDLDRIGTLPANMTHQGYAPDPAAAIAQCDIVLSLSHVAESFGRTVLEAMAAGRPVICYDRGTPPATLGRNGDAGRVVATDQPDAVVEVLQLWVREPDAMASMSRAGRRRAAEYLRDARLAARTAFESTA